jgi:HEAT repeats
MRKKLIAAGIILLVVAVAAGWLVRRPLLARYYVRQLESTASEATLERVADLGEAAVPPLVELLKRDAPACQNAARALERVFERWPADDPRAVKAANGLAESFAQYSPEGKAAALELADGWQTPGTDSRDAAAKIVQAALKDDQVSIQTRAIILALKPEFSLAADVVPLLKDPKPEIRRSALLAIGPFRDLAPDEDLLPCLHDPDEEVRARCVSALKSRGLREKDLLLARLISDSSPLKRLEVIRFLPNDTQLDPQAWLGRLCQDSSPIVRATAARFALDAAEMEVDLSPRVRQMAQSDPDGTVRQIAEFLIRKRDAVRSRPID